LRVDTALECRTRPLGPRQDDHARILRRQFPQFAKEAGVVAAHALAIDLPDPANRRPPGHQANRFERVECAVRAVRVLSGERISHPCPELRVGGVRGPDEPHRDRTTAGRGREEYEGVQFAGRARVPPVEVGKGGFHPQSGVQEVVRRPAGERQFPTVPPDEVARVEPVGQVAFPDVSDRPERRAHEQPADLPAFVQKSHLDRYPRERVSEPMG
jgi:hypothetical protein